MLRCLQLSVSFGARFFPSFLSPFVRGPVWVWICVRRSSSLVLAIDAVASVADAGRIVLIGGVLVVRRVRVFASSASPSSLLSLVFFLFCVA